MIGLIRRRFPDTSIRDLSPALDAMRLIKSPVEIEVTREAGRLDALMINECIRATRPDMPRHQLTDIGSTSTGSTGSDRRGTTG